jgi:hypothetical protein
MNDAAYDVRCPECNSSNSPERTHCWLCLRPLPADAPRIDPHAELPLQEVPFGQFSLASMLLIMTLVGIAAALFAVYPGLGILFSLLATPPVIRTILVVKRRKRMGFDVMPDEKAVLFFKSFLVTTVALVVSIIVACISFFTICISIGTPSAIVIATVGALIATGITFWFFWLWIRLRWKRDTRRF